MLGWKQACCGGIQAGKIFKVLSIHSILYYYYHFSNLYLESWFWVAEPYVHFRYIIGPRGPFFWRSKDKLSSFINNELVVNDRLEEALESGREVILVIQL